MKKTILILLTIFFVIIISTYLFLQNAVQSKKLVLKENAEYEKYCIQEIQGVELATLINKAIDENEKNNIKKDKKNYYIENDENSIKIEIKMYDTEKTYAMEEIYNNNITEFIKYFNFTNFKCTNKEWHKKTGRISKMVFEEI